MQFDKINITRKIIVVVGSIFGEKETEETVHFSNKGD